MDDLKAKQDLYTGFGDALARGFELAVMPFFFGGIGFGLDRLFGVTPILTMVFTVLCLVGLGLRMYYGYEADMRAHEAQAVWARRRGGADAGVRAVAGRGTGPQEPHQ